MNKAVTWTVTITVVAVLGYAGYQYLFGGTRSAPAPVPRQQVRQSGPAPGGGSPAGSSRAGAYKNGSYTGSAVDAIYGPVQVEAVVGGGKLTDVRFLQYPSAPGHTSEVSSIALPQLRQEAIQAQSANVDIVSGATQTSEGFMQSLQSALQQAIE